MIKWVIMQKAKRQMSTSLTCFERVYLIEFTLFHCSTSEISEEETDNTDRDNAFVSSMPSIF